MRRADRKRVRQTFLSAVLKMTPTFLSALNEWNKADRNVCFPLLTDRTRAPGLVASCEGPGVCAGVHSVCEQ